MTTEDFGVWAPHGSRSLFFLSVYEMRVNIRHRILRVIIVTDHCAVM